MRGYTLLELTVGLAILGIVVSALGRPVRVYVDRAEVRFAREDLVSLLHDTRTAALGRGGATLRLDVDDRTARIEVGDSILRETPFPASARTRLRLGGGRSETEVSYSGIGLGVFASETFEFETGRARARLVVSAYGRLRRE